MLIPGSENIGIPISMAKALNDSVSFFILIGLGFRMILVSRITMVSKFQPGISLLKVSVIPSPSISHSPSSLSARPSPSVSTCQFLLLGKSSTKSGAPSLSLSFNPRY